MNSAKTILVTGGSGFVGQATVRQLLARGHTVWATTTATHPDLLSDAKLRWIEWDAQQQPLPDVHWEKLQVIIHLATPRKPFHTPRQRELMYQLSVVISQQLLWRAEEHGIPRILLASTGDVLGYRSSPAMEQDTNYQPENFYATTKACAELLFRSASRSVHAAILRFYHPYGLGGDAFLVNRLLEMIQSEQPITIEGQHGILINPVWIDDLAAGICQAAESDAVGIFHLAGPTVLTLRSVLERVGTLLNKSPQIRSQPGRCSQSHTGDYSLTRKVLGYCPATTLDEGLSRLINLTTMSSERNTYD